MGVAETASKETVAGAVWRRCMRRPRIPGVLVVEEHRVHLGRTGMEAATDSTAKRIWMPEIADQRGCIDLLSMRLISYERRWRSK